MNADTKYKNERPVVAVTGPAKCFSFGWFATKLQLSRVGLDAIYVTPEKPELTRDVAGIIIGGGDDIDPKHYGILGSAGSNYDAARDSMEIEIIKHGINQHVPILGICRGAQLINVVRGGTLHSDIRPMRKLTPNYNSVFPVKNAELVQGTALAAIFNQVKSIRVNSLHKQAIEKLGRGLTINAIDDDGFVQGFESEGMSFMVGVQWHPEYMLLSKMQLNLFKAFSDSVSRFDQVVI